MSEPSTGREWPVALSVPSDFFLFGRWDWNAEVELRGKLREQEAVIALLVRMVKSNPLPQWWTDLLEDTKDLPPRTIQEERNFLQFDQGVGRSTSFPFPKDKRWFTYAVYQPDLYRMPTHLSAAEQAVDRWLKEAP